MAETSINIQIDSELKNKADELFTELGLDTATAINLFIRQALRLGKIPFELAVDRPNEETIMAMLEANRILNDPETKRYKNVDELFADLETECNEEQ